MVWYGMVLYTKDYTVLIYRKIPLKSPGPIQLRKGFWVGL